MSASVNRGQHGPFQCFQPEQRDAEQSPLVSASIAPLEHRSLQALLLGHAGRLIDWTLHAELEILLGQHASLTDEHGRAAYVRNGYQPPRDLLTNLGPVRIRIPKVRSRIDRPVIFRSALARPYLRRARIGVDGAAARFLRGLGAGDLHAAIAALMGPEAAALPGPVIRRLFARWEREHNRWLAGSLAQLRRPALWLDSIDGDDDLAHGNRCVLVAVAIDESAGQKILSIVQGSCRSEEIWTHLLRGLRNRGMEAPLRVHASAHASSRVAPAMAIVYPQARLDH